MANLNIAVQILANDRASGPMGNVTRSVDDLKRAASQSKTPMDLMREGLAKIALVAGTVGAAVAIAKKAFDWAEEGAQIQRTTDRFDALNESVGAVADDTLKRLQNEVDGSVTKLALMENANLLLSTGAAATDDELVSLVGNIIKLKKPTDDASGAIENFSLLLANKSIPRLDSFGLSSSKVKDRYEELKKTVDDDTAFRTAVFEEMQVALQNVGEEGDYTADAFTRLRTKAEDARDRIKVLLSDALEPLAEILAGQADRIEEVVSAQVEQIASVEDLKDIYKDLNQEMEKSPWYKRGDYQQSLENLQKQIALNVGSFEEYVEVGQELGFLQENLSKQERGLQEQYYNSVRVQHVLERATQRTGDELARQGLYLQQNNQTTQITIGILDSLHDGYTTVAGVLAMTRDAFDEERTAMDLAADAARGKAQAIIDLEQAIGGYFDQALTANQETQTLEQMLYQSGVQAGLTAEQLVILAGATGDFTEEEIKAAFEAALMKARIDEMVKSVQAGTMTAGEAVAALQDLSKAEEQAGSDADGLAKDLQRVSGEAETARGKVQELDDKLKDLPSFLETQINAVVNLINGGAPTPPAQPAPPTGGNTPQTALPGIQSAAPGVSINAVVRSDADVERLAYQVADIMRRRG